MVELLKRTEEYRIDTEEEAEVLLEKEKKNSSTESYEISSYNLIKKEKKSKGEVIDSYVILKITKVW